MTSICRPRACRHRATAAIWRHRLSAARQVQRSSAPYPAILFFAIAGTAARAAARAAQGNSVAAFGPVVMKPTATLACPMVSALDRWLADSVQPAAMRWFGIRVAEIKQISAYSCRGMNGNSRAQISEHAFGKRSTSRRFTLADGRTIW
jgi:hypothetical protein